MKRNTFKSIVETLLLTAGLWAAPARATVDFGEGFEYADSAALGNAWSSSCVPASSPGMMELSNTRIHSGSQALKLTFPPPDSEGGCFMSRHLSAPTDVFYMRVFVYLDNFSNNTGVPTKMWEAAKENTYPNFWGMIGSGGTSWGVAITNTAPGVVATVAGGSIPQQQWACLEYQITMNTPGAANGIIQAWVNSTLVASRTDLMLRGATDNGQFNTPASNIAFVETYRQHGLGTIYYDDYAASRDARIGCGSTPPPPPPPATVPTDLNGDGTTNVTDVQLGVNQALGTAACSSGDVNKDGVCNVVDVQQIVNKALGL